MLDELVTLLWKKDDPDGPVDEDELDPDVDVLCLNTLDVLVETVLHLIGGNSPVLVSCDFFPSNLYFCTLTPII
jgi:hypothetical protein